MKPVTAKVLFVGLNNSAEFVAVVPEDEALPPVTKTKPPAIEAAAAPNRTAVMLPVDVQVPFAGLKSSAHEVVDPPATSTLPVLRSIAMWPKCAQFIPLVRLNAPVDGE